MVSRLLKGFTEQGWVRLSREQIEITDSAALRRFALSYVIFVTDRLILSSYHSGITSSTEA